jgi:APA family basic amino acid/polyamine antiporter|nr:amino acid permease [Kofleriaceae bacterium]
MAAELERRLGVFSATTLIVGSMIGSGIFIAPSIMAGLVGSPAVYLGLWLIGGVLTLLGGLAYGELCAMMPKAGGQYVFLREAFGPLTGFLYGWTVFLVIQSGFNAAVAIAFSKFLSGVGLQLGETDTILQVGAFTLSRAQVVAVGVIVVLTWVNCRGVEAGAFVQNVFTVFKVGAIALLVVIGFSSGDGSFSNFTAAGTSVGLAAIGVAMSKALFAYDAWNTVTFAAEEIREPQRNLPRALIYGTVVTTLVYTGAAAVYLYVLPLGDMANVTENRVASDVAGALLGAAGVTAVSIAILVSTFGCVNGLVLGGGRVLFAMARDKLFFGAAGRVDQRRGTPRNALVLQGIWSSVLALSGSYSALLTYVTFASLAFNALTVLGLFVLRAKQPDAPRPYKTWGYPVTPAVYLLGAAFFILYIFIGDPSDAGIGIALVALGLPAYLLFKRRQ